MIVSPLKSTKISGFDPKARYAVLAIEQTSSGIHFRIRSCDRFEPALYPADQFEVHSNQLSRYWQFVQQNGRWRLGPESWYLASFLERFYDHEPQATADFEKLASKIEQEATQEM